ncbi:spore germination protein [Litchfieldia salsa]|uniref:Spore germination protein PF n=1 Tax=Litchfieldia salsa TaxID=930152 RepID=A0A1H0QB65_9BACI|nr:spore germination protein [Litchfieldia salsa]SDP14587.1 spore germination protein PF [Litchfieldia salsa]
MFGLGPIILNSNDGIITGGTLNASPSSTSKVVAGAGSFNTGYWVNTNTLFNLSNSVDPDSIDSNIEEGI